MAEDCKEVEDAAFIMSWVKSEGGKYSEAFEMDSSGDEAIVVHEEILTSFEKLVRALEHYRSNARTELEFDIRDCPWKTVYEHLHLAQEAMNRHSKATKLPGGVLPYIWRGMGRTSKIVVPGLETIPDELFFGIIKGSLAVIFSIARLKVENADKILDAFEDIPTHILAAEELREAHPGNSKSEKRLEKAIQHFYATLTRVIPDMIAFLDPRAVRDKLKSPIKAAVKGHEIDRMLSDVKRSIGEVQRVGQQLTDATMAKFQDNMYKLQRKMDEDLGGYASEASDNYELVRTISADVKNRASQESVTQLQSMVQTQTTTVQRLMAEIHEMKEMFRENAQEGLFLFLGERLDQLKREIPRGIVPVPVQVPRPATEEEADALIKILGSRKLERSINDIAEILKKRGNLPFGAEQEARMLWKSDHFLRWLNSPWADVLFVTSLAIQGRMSALSVVCATMAWQFLDEETSHSWVHFFCGEHTRPDDELRGPEGVIRSLVGQLATHLQSRRLLLVERAWPMGLNERPEPDRFEILCSLFRQLVSQLPTDSILFCVIDGASHCQSEGFLYVASQLRGLTVDQSLGVRVKFLITGPTRYEALSQALQLGDYQQVKLKRYDGRSLQVPMRTSRHSI